MIKDFSKQLKQHLCRDTEFESKEVKIDTLGLESSDIPQKSPCKELNDQGNHLDRLNKENNKTASSSSKPNNSTIQAFFLYFIVKVATVTLVCNCNRTI